MAVSKTVGSAYVGSNPAPATRGNRLMQPDAAVRRCLPLVDGELHPPVDGDVIDCNPVLGQQLLHIAVNRP